MTDSFADVPESTLPPAGSPLDQTTGDPEIDQALRALLATSSDDVEQHLELGSELHELLRRRLAHTAEQM
ncbi:hypothetical protein KEM60_03198 [Austwickia sp. TVS 96-490-7B]|uniref:hypothetical protein n=1 Tax=Austwickia sp. TVS 96-490-7B TaxID=2830843 RepID=UPI001C567157|nr:hypothetical protein [Austwickia sp. TVS 96-490-7B]MBW3086969.1 hypothetical protein [Austwickia sp. TVS 96-490-7B]